mmetsp:Transcript_24298/g.57210  ORF Transcript_24298/g.57210 Transcript_24298/m.57210 type:complete len:107 (+) Transcript_24298:817-1137(+)
MVTLPITEAEGAMKLFAPGSAGATPSTETILLEGTSRSVYLATSMLAPNLSSEAPILLAAPEAATAIFVEIEDIVGYLLVYSSDLQVLSSEGVLGLLVTVGSETGE